MIEKFREWYENRHEYAKQWKKKTGGKVVGYFCTYTPEEILYAADILPVRILGGHEPPTLAEPHIFSMYCPFCRDCLNQGLSGKYDYLDGIVIAQSCLHMRQAFTSWQLHIPVEYSYYLPMPNNVQSPRAIPYLANELNKFKTSIEKWSGTQISDNEIEKGIKIMNRNRQLLRRVYELRKKDKPPISGLESMYMSVSSQLVDKNEHSNLLEHLIPSLASVEHNPGIRLMLVGSENDDVGFVKMLESLDATVVIDDHCTGSRYFWNEVELLESQDMWESIALRYINRPPCPSKDWPERRRLPHILKLAKDYNVRGAILIQQKFCDPHETEIPVIVSYLKESDIPTYFLEFDVTIPLGQFKVRIEAFLEMLRGEELF